MRKLVIENSPCFFWFWRFLFFARQRICPPLVWPALCVTAARASRPYVQVRAWKSSTTWKCWLAIVFTILTHVIRWYASSRGVECNCQLKIRAREWGWQIIATRFADTCCYVSSWAVSFQPKRQNEQKGPGEVYRRVQISLLRWRIKIWKDCKDRPRNIRVTFFDFAYNFLFILLPCCCVGFEDVQLCFACFQRSFQGEK